MPELGALAPPAGKLPVMPRPELPPSPPVVPKPGCAPWLRPATPDLPPAGESPASGAAVDAAAGPPIALVALALPAVSVLLPVAAVLPAIAAVPGEPKAADRSVLDEGSAGVTFAVLLPVSFLTAAWSFLPQAGSDSAAAAETIRTHQRVVVREFICRSIFKVAR